MGFESRRQTSRAGNLRLLAGCAAQWFKGGEGFRVALTGRCMSGRSHQGRGFGSARALPGAHRRRWPPHAPCGRDCAIMIYASRKPRDGGGSGTPGDSRHLALARGGPDPGTHSHPPMPRGTHSSPDLGHDSRWSMPSARPRVARESSSTSSTLTRTREGPVRGTAYALFKVLLNGVLG